VQRLRPTARQGVLQRCWPGLQKTKQLKKVQQKKKRS
jgi:hypothetical protein